MHQRLLKSLRMVSCLGLASLCACAMALEPERDDPPRLVLQITVDQLRADLPARHYDRLGQGGFRYLWEKGTVYANARHSHANTETIVGHATLATGATPAVHGMIGNVWLDRETGETVYNIEDGRYRLLTPGADVDSRTEIDPTMRAARSEGRSPAAILVSTVGDELVAHTAGRAKVFGVSIKDRGAVSMAGHAGKAFWFSKTIGQFVSSTYYYDRYPKWVDEWNEQKAVSRYSGQSWELLHPRSQYLFGEADDRPWETDLAGFGRVFPHPWGSADSPYHTTLLTTSPAGDELTLSFVKSLIEHEGLGRDAVPDYLAVSFSSTDYVGHLFGPSSLEAEDNLLRLDRALADLFSFIDARIGLGQTLIVLSADHGGPDPPGYSNSIGIPAGYVEPEKWDSEAAIFRLKSEFGITGPLIESYQHPYVYLTSEINSSDPARRLAIERAVAAELARFPAVSLAVSSRALEQGTVPDTDLIRAVLRNFNPKRSGDVYVVFEPNSFINDFDGLEVASVHGSPWSYDTFVPLVFAGQRIGDRRISRRVYTVDVAPTLAHRLGTKRPSGANGNVLPEIMD